MKRYQFLFIKPQLANRLKELLTSLARDYIQQIYQRESEICAFGIFTDGDMDTYLWGYNTQVGLEKIRQAGKVYQAEFPETNTPIDAGKWWIPDWENGIPDDLFRDDPREKEIYQIIEGLQKNISYAEDSWESQDFVNYKADMFELYCQVLKELQVAGVFSHTCPDFFLLVQEGDNGLYDMRASNIAKIMTTAQLEAYKAYLEME